MKLKLITCSVALSVAASTTFAATADSLKLELDKLKASQVALEKQVEALKTGKGKEGGSVHMGPIGGGMIAGQSSRFGRDLQMLGLLQKAGKDAPRLTIGGNLEADVVYGRNVADGSSIYNSQGYVKGQNASAIFLDTARLDLLAKLNDWAFVDWQLDFASGADTRSGYLTIGNLDKSPVYLSAGKYFPYFGDFGGHVYNNPLSTDYFRISSAVGAIALGYSQDNLNVSAALFKSKRANVTQVKDWTLQANYSFKVGQVKAKVGAGYVADITGHALSDITAQNTLDALPAANVSAKMAVGPVSFKVNYAQTTKDVNRTDMQDKKVSAYNIQAGYSTTIIKPIDFSVSYSATKNLNGVVTSNKQFKNQVLVGAGVAVMPGAYVSLEYGNIAQYANPTLESSDTNRYSVLTLDFWLTF
ncbi:hypothetical protein AVI51_15335 [Piscirickettsia salmonis]|uniref:Porin n=1 Tax=Piscirickettsia salmonis TaxID=1238 RepID=A0A095DMF9_PISSA|nr:LbtU family siderophore porin [Piscirickettsia salmonis]RNC78040.1 hypothetical protein DA717_06900 [Piscirickettsiaceae bacterium NZ-RLO2]AKP73367.1 hypothetical protein PSLF89_1460 [Piscirickettsia salmonis LF-89 = ATCC VR-1361]ALA24405.1 porin [Piscirickettsia salmonis]ALB22090.1 porin [Piscirickettsia salmonis]ALY04189.1 hypothetical protein AWE47_04590 [Piscirickettsia salmonis]